MPSGAAPEQARFRAASATAILRAFVRIEIDVGRVAIDGQRDEFFRRRRRFARRNRGSESALMRTTAASEPGQTTEPSRTM